MFKTSNRISQPKQFLTSILLVSIVAAACYLLSGLIGYKIVALLLLVTVSLLAMFFDIFPVLVAAILSALMWDFFFIPPRFTFVVNSAEDSLLLLMYFVVASVNAVLTYKIRQAEKEIRKKEQKENTLKLYNVLLNSLSHELRTPISTIIGATDNLMTNISKLSEQQKNSLLKDISNSSLQLNHHVENLLNMSRLESGFLQLKKDWCDITEMVYTVLKQFDEELKEHQVKVEIKEGLPLFKLDAGLMEQVLYNLLSNEARYTPEGSVIRIQVSHSKEKLLLSIEDNGEGFPADEIDMVFDKFYRLKKNKTGGTGLGLSIVKGFVEEHGGKVRLRNAEPVGARFEIEIPAETSFITQLKNE